MIGRNTELHQLEQFYQQEGSQIYVLYGRKEHGSRELVRKFCTGKPFFYYYAPETSAQAQQQRMGLETASYFQVSGLDGSYEAILQSMKSKNGAKLVFVVDEFQNIIKKDPMFFDTLRKRKEGKLCPEPSVQFFYPLGGAGNAKDFGRCSEKN